MDEHGGLERGWIYALVLRATSLISLVVTAPTIIVTLVIVSLVRRIRIVLRLLLIVVLLLWLDEARLSVGEGSHIC